jgi:hypothetical protein
MTVAFWVHAGWAAVLAAGLLSPQCNAAADDERIRALEEQVQRLTERIHTLESTRPAREAATPDADTARRWKWSGDFRYRHEQLELTGDPTRERERIQGHVGFEARATDAVTVGLGIATGGEDPRSAMQTFTDSASRKGVGLDLAWLRWQLSDALAVAGGKMSYPFYRPALSRFHDRDVRPEGLALNWSRGSLFASAYGFRMQDRATPSDTNYSGVQGGMRNQLGPGTLTAAVSWSDLGAGQGHAPFFLGISNGNTVNADGTLTYDFRIAGLSADYSMKLRGVPLTFYLDLARNAGAPENNEAYGVAAQIGTASDANTWELAYLYQEIQRDALFGQFVDSDFGAGLTDSRGSMWRVAYAVSPRVILNVNYFANDIGIASDAPAADYERLQLEANLRY